MREYFVQKGEEASPYNKSKTGEDFEIHLPTGKKRFSRSQKGYQIIFEML